MAEAQLDKTIKFELVSPERVLASGEAEMVVVPGEAGDLGVLPEHAPLVSSLRPGVVVLHMPGGSVQKIFVSGGFADISPKLCSVLAEEAVNVAEINRAETEKEIASLKNDLAASGDDAVKAGLLQKQLNVAQGRLTAAA